MYGDCVVWATCPVANLVEINIFYDADLDSPVSVGSSLAQSVFYTSGDPSHFDDASYHSDDPPLAFGKCGRRGTYTSLINRSAKSLWNVTFLSCAHATKESAPCGIISLTLRWCSIKLVMRVIWFIVWIMLPLISHFFTCTDDHHQTPLRIKTK